MGIIRVSAPGGFGMELPAESVPEGVDARLQLSVRHAYQWVLRLDYPDAVTEARGRYLPVRRDVQIQKVHNQLRNPKLMREREETARAVLNDVLVRTALHNYFGGA